MRRAMKPYFSIADFPVGRVRGAKTRCGKEAGTLLTDLSMEKERRNAHGTMTPLALAKKGEAIADGGERRCPPPPA